MRGWVLDCYPDMDADRMVLWFKTPRGPVRVVDDMTPHIYVHATKERLQKLTNDLAMIGVKDAEPQKRKVSLGEKEKDVLAVPVREYASLQSLAMTIDSWGRYREHALFNVDLRMDQRYFLSKGLFAMGLTEIDGLKSVDAWRRIDYPVPELKGLDLGVAVNGSGIPTMDDGLASISANGVVLDGSEERMLEDLMSLVRDEDPDIIYTDRGDSFVLPYLQHRASLHGMSLELGREQGERTSRGKSYFTYGRIVYKPPAHKLRGRVHIDRQASFTYAEAGLPGLIEMSRLSHIPLQDISRLSPGSAISAMQVNEAVRSGHLVRWKKNLPEDFKTAGALIACDRGGFIYEPKVGIHDDVWEVDFFSLYPSIMVRYNISPETLNCRCCPTSSRIVPELGYRVCEKSTGLVPHVLEPILNRRRVYKSMKNDPRKGANYQQRAKALKWVLVTCFGYTGYRNARFGRIECHESITAYGRDILIRSAAIAESRGFEVLHGIVDSLWLHGSGNVRRLCDEISAEFGIQLNIEGRYRWIVFLPNVSTGVGALNRYYGLFEDGELKLRGIAVRRKDTPMIVEELQQDMLRCLSKAHDAERFVETIPEALQVVDRYAAELRNGTVAADRLIVRRRITRRLEEYAQFNDSVAALRQLHDKGFELQPGQSIEYVILDSGSERSWERVRAAPFLSGDDRYDGEKYVEMVHRGASELLSPFGWSFERMRQRDGSQRR